MKIISNLFGKTQYLCNNSEIINYFCNQIKIFSFANMLNVKKQIYSWNFSSHSIGTNLLFDLDNIFGKSNNKRLFDCNNY